MSSVSKDDMEEALSAVKLALGTSGEDGSQEGKASAMHPDSAAG